LWYNGEWIIYRSTETDRWYTSVTCENRTSSTQKPATTLLIPTTTTSPSGHLMTGKSIYTSTSTS
ncbi:hypothetical protein PMAYCL1PPCAC_13578, partial [Pristionchus mayeri]